MRTDSSGSVFTFSDRDGERRPFARPSGAVIPDRTRLNPPIVTDGRVRPRPQRSLPLADRYHARFITTPTQARNAIRYVLGNWRHHGHDEGWDERVRDWDVDYMSSAVSFPGWKELADRPFQYDVPESHRLCVSPPRTWLLLVGWKKSGSISMYDVPGGRMGMAPPAKKGRRDRARSRAS